MANQKIGIFVPEHHGDMALCTAILKYKDILWPSSDIIWYCNFAPEKSTYLDMLKFNDMIAEVRDWPREWFKNLMDPNTYKLRPEKRREFADLADLEMGYFPAPWAVLPSPQYNNEHYALIPKIVFGADPAWEWHPYLKFSDEEREMAKDFVSSLPYKKTIMFETQLRSAGDFRMSEGVLRNIMYACRQRLGNCNFIFASKIDHTALFDDPGVVSCSHFTVRQCSLIHDLCDLFIGVCSGITMAASCWGAKPVPRVELCGSQIRSSVIANGPVNSVICDNMQREDMFHKLEFEVGQTINLLW